jgi:hypothetical protein
MLSLRDTQARFARALLSGAHGAGMPGICSDGLSPALRLRFYRTNVYGNYLDALRATYPAVAHAVGRAHFLALGERFVREVPSRSGDLNRYGGDFSELLASAPVALDLPWLPDLARLEWAMEEAFYEADHAPLSLERLATVAPQAYDRLVFVLHPACRLLRSRHPVRRLWQAAQRGDGAASAEADEGGESLLIRRAGHEVVVEPLCAAEFAMLEAFRDGAGLAAACERAATLEAGFDPGAVLQRHVASAALVDFRIASEAPGEESLSVA